MPVLKDLLLESKDGEWGKGDAAPDTRPMIVIRGTDFERVRLGQWDDLPQRHIVRRIADRKRLKPLDILIETAGGSKDRPTGRTVLLAQRAINAVSLPVTCASFARFLRIDTLKVDPAYVFWLLQYLYNTGVMRKYHTQHTGVARFQYTTFSETEQLRLPNLAIQRRIAAILSAYDDLIENNTRRIAILEEMARRLYEEWFVHFRFPGHEQARMVESDLGPIPEGWEVQRLDEVASYISRGIAPKYDGSAECLVINQKCIRNKRLDLSLARRQSRVVPPDKYVRFGDVLINSTGVGTLGRVVQVYHQIQECTIDTHVTIVRPGGDVDIDYFGTCLAMHEPYFEQQGVGSTGQTELSRGRIGETMILMPPRQIQGRFGEVICPMRELCVSLAATNINLRAQRDLLLPRLISGEIDVSEVRAPEADAEAA
jgi:type I restriction enzyme, S subunit